MTRPAHIEILAGGEVAGWRPHLAETAVDGLTTGDLGASLVRRAQHGDATAFDDLARVRIDHVYRLAVAILRSEMDARDAIQEALVSAWRHLPTLRDPAHFDVWLDRIVINACRMSLRHRRVVRLREVDVGDPAEPRPGVTVELQQAGPADAVADADLVRRAMEHLDADQRAILVMHHVEDRPIDEIAGVLGIPSGTVKWRLHAARAALQRAFEEESR
jgi:RNA polymerase sigma-70 factor (ECF subfamily)